MDNTKADGVRRQLILKEEIAQKEKIIEEDKANSEHNIVKNVKRKEVKLTNLLYTANTNSYIIYKHYYRKN